MGLLRHLKNFSSKSKIEENKSEKDIRFNSNRSSSNNKSKEFDISEQIDAIKSVNPDLNIAETFKSLAAFMTADKIEELKTHLKTEEVIVGGERKLGFSDNSSLVINEMSDRTSYIVSSTKKQKVENKHKIDDIAENSLTDFLNSKIKNPEITKKEVLKSNIEDIASNQVSKPQVKKEKSKSSFSRRMH